MKIIFLAYREWALEVAWKISELYFEGNDFLILKEKSELDQLAEKIEYEDVIIIAIGWSWIIDSQITDKTLCLGVHPSDLPNYRGGSPIQNQIIDGVKKTKCSLFRISEKLDAGDIWGKSDLSLCGDSMSEILNNLKVSSINLLSGFMDAYPNINSEPQILSVGSYFRRRKPEDSRIFLEEIDLSDISKLYDKIRCLTEPYPNAYLEDEKGNRLFFEKIRFVSSE